MRILFREAGKWLALGVIAILVLMNFGSISSALRSSIGTDSADVRRGNTANVRGSTAPVRRTHNQRADRRTRTREVPRSVRSYEGLRSSARNIQVPKFDEDPTGGADYLASTPISTGPSVLLNSDRHGHFFADVRLNGRSIPTMVDTGASWISLSYEGARAAGIFVSPSDYTAYSRTANGIVKVAPVMIDQVDLDGLVVRNVRASVAEPGVRRPNLLGMSFLGRLKRFEMRGDRLILEN